MNPLLNQNLKKNEFALGGWEFSVQTAIITKSTEIDAKSEALDIQHCPEQVFGSNIATLSKKNSPFKIVIDPWESLSFCNYEKSNKHNKGEAFSACKDFSVVNYIPNEIKVKHTEIWKEKKLDSNPDVKEMEKISEPFFCTPYKGTITPSENSHIETTDEDIPLGNLTPANPIQWHEHLILWEDELGDNGISTLDFRFRVMKDCFFGLLRHYLRVDDVAIRVTDTRIYHDFSKGYILREFCVKEGKYENISSKGFKFTTDWMTNPSQSFMVAEYLETIFVSKEKILV